MSGKGPYLRAHNKLSLGMDRILPAIAAVEASTLELIAPGSVIGPATGFKETEQSQAIARASGRGATTKSWSHSSSLWVDPPPHMKAPPRSYPAKRSDGEDEPQQDGNRTLFRDFRTLAAASRRAHNPAAEGSANFCIGILHDNAGDHAKATPHLQRFLQSSRATGQVEHQVLAVNALGVNVQLQGMLDEALQYHRKHLDLAQEHMSQFVAYTNLGVTATAQGNHKQALSYHEGALRCAVQAGTLRAESCATVNLGCAAMALSDLENAGSLLERYLQLSQSLKDAKGTSDALMFLGKLASIRSDLGSASGYFSQAMQLSTTGHRETATNSAKCSFGIASGTMALNAQLDALKETLTD